MRIVCDETKGLAIKLASNEKKRQVTLSDITNNLLSNLLAVYIAQTTEENREALYSQLSVAFSNVLGYYAPDIYFPDEQKAAEFEKAVAVLAADAPDNSEEIEKAKELLRERMKETGDAMFPGLTAGQTFVVATEEEYNEVVAQESKVE